MINLEKTDCIETFRQHMVDRLSDLPASAAVDTARNAAWYARLKGLRGSTR